MYVIICYESRKLKQWKYRNDEDYGSRRINDVMNLIETWRTLSTRIFITMLCSRMYLLTFRALSSGFQCNFHFGPAFNATNATFFAVFIEWTSFLN